MKSKYPPIYRRNNHPFSAAKLAAARRELRPARIAFRSYAAYLASDIEAMFARMDQPPRVTRAQRARQHREAQRIAAVTRTGRKPDELPF